VLVRRAGAQPLRVGAAMLLGMLIVYGAGAGWLAGLIGPERAVEAGVVPFLLGDAVKAALATALVLAFGRSARAAE